MTNNTTAKANSDEAPRGASSLGTWVFLGCIVGGAMLVQAWPAAQSWLQYDRAAVSGGQWWRLLTCHLTHYGWSNAMVNIWAFAVLFAIGCSRQARVTRVVMLSAIAVGLAVHFLAGDIATYRGLSGIAYGLAACVLVCGMGILPMCGTGVSPVSSPSLVSSSVLQQQQLRQKQDRAGTALERMGKMPMPRRLIWLVVLACILVKAILDAVGVNLMSPATLPAGVAVVGWAHLSGLLGGATVETLAVWRFSCNMSPTRRPSWLRPSHCWARSTPRARNTDS